MKPSSKTSPSKTSPSKPSKPSPSKPSPSKPSPSKPSPSKPSPSKHSSKSSSVKSLKPSSSPSTSFIIPPSKLLLVSKNQSQSERYAYISSQAIISLKIPLGSLVVILSESNETNENEKDITQSKTSFICPLWSSKELQNHEIELNYEVRINCGLSLGSLLSITPLSFSVQQFLYEKKKVNINQIQRYLFDFNQKNDSNTSSTILSIASEVSLSLSSSSLDLFSFSRNPRENNEKYMDFLCKNLLPYALYHRVLHNQTWVNCRIEQRQTIFYIHSILPFKQSPHQNQSVEIINNEITNNENKENIGFIITNETKFILLPPSISPLDSQIISSSLSSSTISTEKTEELKHKIMKELNLVFGGISTKNSQKIIQYIVNPLILSSCIQSASLLSPSPSFQSNRHGILIYGGAGVGKSELINSLSSIILSNLPQTTFLSINSTDLLSDYYSVSENMLRRIFQKATRSSPTLLFIDDIHLMFPQKDESSSHFEGEQKLVSCLYSVLDELTKDKNTENNTNNNDNNNNKAVIVIGSTNQISSIPSPLRRAGRLDREIHLEVPSVIEREQILNALLRKVNHSLTEDQVRSISQLTHAFVGSDLSGLIRESFVSAYLRIISSNSEPNIESVENVIITYSDISQSVVKVRPSSLKEILVEVPSVKWSQVAGQSDIKQLLREAVHWPIDHPEAFLRMGITPPRGVLLYGPPGCSKTMMARALATESGLNFIAVKGPELYSKWVGDSEKAVRSIFQKARAASPAILFFDELDGLACKRSSSSESSTDVTERVLSQLLLELDGLHSFSDSEKTSTFNKLIVVGATNRPDLIDTALLRPGRLDRLIYVPPPDHITRLEILSLQLSKIPHSLSEEFLFGFSKRCEGFSGAEVSIICREASLCALRRDINANEAREEDFETALKGIKPQITPEMLRFYDEFRGKGNTFCFV